MDELNVFVIHVRGAIEREENIRHELKKHNLSFEFILDGNKEDITTGILNQYFSGQMHEKSARTSCAIKHIFAYQKIIDKKIPYALIFEDDIELKKNFRDVIQKIQKEYQARNLSNFIISLENSGHNYVKKQELVKGQILYKKKHGRCAGAYIIDNLCAQNMLDIIKNDKCSLPIDWFHNAISEENKINIYWSFPHIAVQGSHNGKIASLIDNKPKGWFRSFLYYCQTLIKSKQR